LELKAGFAQRLPRALGIVLRGGLLFRRNIATSRQPLPHPPDIDPSPAADRNGRDMTAVDKLKAQPV